MILIIKKPIWKRLLLYDTKKFNEALAVFQTLVTVKNTYPDGYYWL